VCLEGTARLPVLCVCVEPQEQCDGTSYRREREDPGQGVVSRRGWTRISQPLGVERPIDESPGRLQRSPIDDSGMGEVSWNRGAGLKPSSLVWKLEGERERVPGKESLAGVPTRGKGTRPARFEACKPALGGGSHPALHPRLRQADTGARRRNKNTYRWVCSAGRRRDNHTSGKATPCRCRRRHRRNTRN
jgi:hypothetical protein